MAKGSRHTEESKLLMRRPRDKPGVRGENMHNSKLTAPQVLEMRERYFNEHIPYRYFAKKYGTSITSIWKAINKRSWKHI